MTDLTSGEKRVWLQHPSLRIGAIASLVLLLVAFTDIRPSVHSVRVALQGVI